MLRKTSAVLFLFLLCLAAAIAQTQPATSDGSLARRNPPKIDHHQHLFSPGMAEFQKIVAITAQDVIKLLDDAGIEKAVLLPPPPPPGRRGREPQDEYAKVKEENDWVGAQAALYPRRLIAFCGFNP